MALVVAVGMLFCAGLNIFLRFFCIAQNLLDLLVDLS